MSFAERFAIMEVQQNENEGHIDIIELTILVVTCPDLLLAAVFHGLFKPNASVPPIEASNTHGLRNRNLESAQLFSEAVADVRRFLEDNAVSVIIGDKPESRALTLAYNVAYRRLLMPYWSTLIKEPYMRHHALLWQTYQTSPAPLCKNNVHWGYAPVSAYKRRNPGAVVYGVRCTLKYALAMLCAIRHGKAPEPAGALAINYELAAAEPDTFFLEGRRLHTIGTVSMAAKTIAGFLTATTRIAAPVFAPLFASTVGQEERNRVFTKMVQYGIQRAARQKRAGSLPLAQVGPRIRRLSADNFCTLQVPILSCLPRKIVLLFTSKYRLPEQAHVHMVPSGNTIDETIRIFRHSIRMRRAYRIERVIFDDVLKTAVKKQLLRLLREARAAFCDLETVFIIKDPNIFRKAPDIGRKYNHAYLLLQDDTPMGIWNNYPEVFAFSQVA